MAAAAPATTSAEGSTHAGRLGLEPPGAVSPQAHAGIVTFTRTLVDAESPAASRTVTLAVKFSARA